MTFYRTIIGVVEQSVEIINQPHILDDLKKQYQIDIPESTTNIDRIRQLKSSKSPQRNQPSKSPPKKVSKIRGKYIICMVFITFPYYFNSLF